MSDWKTVCRFCGVLIAIPAALWLVLVVYFPPRFEDAGEYDSLMTGDVVVGGMLALALVLFCAPRLPGAPRWKYILAAVSALLIWAAMSASLIRSHDEQFQSRLERSNPQMREP